MRLFKWLDYEVFARHEKGHGIHSPFLYNLVIQVFDKKKEVPEEDRKIRQLRKKWKTSDARISYEDPGAGAGGGRSRKISRLAKVSSTSEKYGHLLFRLVRRFQPEVILELGTCLGLGTQYLSAGNKNARIITLEGVPALANLAVMGFQELGRTNIELVEGRFEDALPVVLKSLEKLDLVFFDGNHTLEATLAYFDLCRAKAHDDTVFILDDIHWSKEMEEAWNRIKMYKDVTLAIDLFRMGLVFFRRELSKQNMVIRF